MKVDPLTLILVPGLSRGLIAGGALPRLHSSLATARVAGLVCSFPCLPVSVEASALRGQIPRSHAVCFSGDAPNPEYPTVGEALLSQRAGSFLDAGSTALSALRPDPQCTLLVVRYSGLLDAALRDGPASAARLHAASSFDTQLQQLRDSLAADHTLILLGGPSPRAAQQRIQLPELASAYAVEKESALLRVRLEGEASCARAQEKLLGCRGIERVLRGEALHAWGVSDGEDRGELYALAQAGWSFEDSAAAVGHPEVPSPESGVIIVLGKHAPGKWPAELHDYRLAPSLARRFGLPETKYLDRAFAL